jgi:hypothetical protein
MIIPIHQDYLDTTLSQCHAYLNLVDLVHIIHNQIEHLIKVCYVPNIAVSESCSVVILYSTPYIHTPCYPINSLNLNLKHHSFISNPMLTYSCSPVLHYSICKWVNWVIQCFINPCPKPKCNAYYFWVIVVTLIHWYCYCTIWHLCDSIQMSHSNF